MVWLIGNKGMLGSEVEKLLVSNELPFICSDLEVDITDENSLRSHINEKGKEVEWIVNCSAYTAVDQAEEEPEKAFKVNSNGVFNLAQMAKTLNATLIHVSTDYVFDGKKQSPYLENDEPNPVGVYGKSKWQGDQHIIRNLNKYFIFRTAWLYGKNGQNFVNTMLQLFERRDTVRVVSDQWGSPTYAKDLAGTIVDLIRNSRVEYGIYHYSNLGRISWYDFAKKILEIALCEGIIHKTVELVPITTTEYPTKATRPKNSCLSKEKIMKTFGQSIRSWEEALEEYIIEEVRECEN